MEVDMEVAEEVMEADMEDTGIVDGDGVGGLLIGGLSYGTTMNKTET